jgi:hypothetical protein
MTMPFKTKPLQRRQDLSLAGSTGRRAGRASGGPEQKRRDPAIPAVWAEYALRRRKP